MTAAYQRPDLSVDPRQPAAVRPVRAEIERGVRVLPDELGVTAQ